jgi:hypothetical protein
MVVAVAPNKSMASPDSVMEENSHVIRMLEGKISGHQTVKWSSVPPEDSSREGESIEDEVMMKAGPSEIQSATSANDPRGLR